MFKVRMGRGKQVTVSIDGKTYVIRDGEIIEHDEEAEVLRKFVEGAGGEFVLVDEKPKRRAKKKKEE